MGLFDFFKKNTSGKKSGEPPVDANQYLLEELRRRLSDQNYPVEKSAQYLSLTVNKEVEIATAIIDSPHYHPSLMHLMIMTIHKDYFPKGIEEHIVGVGNNIEEKVDSALTNYLATTFPPIMDSLSDSHQPALDFTDKNGILWHPVLGCLAFQGQWSNKPKGEPIFDLLKEKLKNVMPDKKINWLKVYAGRQPDNSITAECMLNNESWEEGYRSVCSYAKNWGQPGNFLGQKQFIMIRRCDAFDK